MPLKLDKVWLNVGESLTSGQGQIGYDELKNKGPADCSFAVKTVPLKSANGLFLDIKAPGAFPACLHLNSC